MIILYTWFDYFGTLCVGVETPTYKLVSEIIIEKKSIVSKNPAVILKRQAFETLTNRLCSESDQWWNHFFRRNKKQTTRSVFLINGSGTWIRTTIR